MFQLALLSQMRNPKYWSQYLQLSIQNINLISNVSITIAMKLNHTTLLYLALLLDVHYKNCSWLSTEEFQSVKLLLYQLIVNISVPEILSV